MTRQAWPILAPSVAACRSATSEANDANRFKARLNKLGPSLDLRFCRPQPKRMPALRVHEQLCGNTGLLERRVVDERVFYRIDGIVLRSNAVGQSRYGPTFEHGTRYFRSTHVMPFDVNQSHASVPSRSMASTL